MRLTPELLADKLISSTCDLDSLMEEFAATSEQIAETLYSSAYDRLRQLRIDLAVERARLFAAQMLPGCTAKLADLISSQKPEVARRSAMALMNIGGIDPKAPLHPAQHPAASDPDLANLPADQRAAFLRIAALPHGQRAELLRLAQLPQDQRQELAELATANTHLKRRHGINLARLTRHQFRGLARHIDAFFHDLAIRFAGQFDPPVPKENSLTNPHAVARAHTLLDQDPAPAPLSPLSPPLVPPSGAPPASPAEPPLDTPPAPQDKLTQTTAFPASNNPPRDGRPFDRPHVHSSHSPPLRLKP